MQDCYKSILEAFIHAGAANETKVNVISIHSEFLDATDGLAVAVCHSFQKISSTGNKKNYSGWDAFAKDNQKRLK